MTKTMTSNAKRVASQVYTDDQETEFFEMDQRKNEFVATLAHEIRNPLAPIRNGLQLLALMGLSADAEIVRSMIARQVDQIVRLVDDLLDISRIGCGKVLLDKQVCMASTIVEAAIETSLISISENGMKLEVIDNSEAACICGDSSRLTQVVSNLLNNSARYGRIGGKICLRLDVADGYLVIQVRDDGIGIAADQLKEIFRMYSQIENAQGRGSAGLGIGLALVRSLVELHGGFVSAHSDGLDCGSTFTVRLPLAGGTIVVNTPSTQNPQASRSLRVLVVDDLRAMRIVTQQLLERLGHEVEIAENGEQALHMLETFRPDVLLSDIAMPGMDGYELARRIREKTELNDVCLVALTGFGQSTDRDFAYKAGFDRHLTKPVSFQRLQDLLGELNSVKHERFDAAKSESGGSLDS